MTTERKLKKNIDVSRWLAALLAVVLVLSYFAYFRQNEPSADPASWGQFGDFVGGLLNPTIAAFAFYWLTQSISLQLKEMHETRAALIASKDAQERHERHAAKTAKLNAYSSLIACYNVDITNLRENISFLALQLAHTGKSSLVNVMGEEVLRVDLVSQLNELRASVEDKLLRRFNLMKEIESTMGREA